MLENKHLLELIEIFNKYFVILNSINFQVKELDERTMATIPLKEGIASNIDAIRALTLSNHCNEMYVVSRSLLERVITYLYLHNCDEKEFKKYIAYTKQKTYRILNKNLSVNDKTVGLKYSGEVDIESDLFLKESLKEFTGEKSGREKTRWSNTTIIKKLEIIDQSGSIKEGDMKLIMLAINTIYDDASEALHATLYGCLFQLGHFLPNVNSKDTDEVKKHYEESMSSVISLSALSAGIVISYIAKKLKLEDLEKEIHDISEALFEKWKQCTKTS